MILLLLGCLFDSANPLFEDADRDGIPQYEGDCFDQDPEITDPFVHDDVGYATLAEAVFAASDGDEVFVCGGTWTEQLQTSTEVFLVGKGAQPAILDAEGAGGSVVRLQNGGGLENLVIKGGTGTGSNGETAGGGVYVDDGDLTVRGCTFALNTAVDGGGLLALGGDVLIEDSIFRGNQAGNIGGGAVVLAGDAQIVRTTFEGNEADYGGALAYQQGALSIDGGAFASNTALEAGGAMAILQDSSVDVSGPAFSGNTPEDLYVQTATRSETMDAPGDSFECTTKGNIPSCD